MIFDIITIFPEFFDSFLKESLIKKALEDGILDIRAHNLRDFTEDTHNTVDDKPFGGGRGMVFKIEPIFKAVQSLKNQKLVPSEVEGSKSKNPRENSRIILFSPRGKKFNQKKAFEFSKLDQLIMICGRYEGVDERIAEYIADEIISIGDFVLMGGEVAAMAVIESVARLVESVVGKTDILMERVSEKKGFIDYPQYTRPEVFSPEPGVEWKVPEVLLSGHHKKIEEWRKKHSKTVE